MNHVSGFPGVIHSAMAQVADRLGSALNTYWPCRHHKSRTNAVPEQNAVSRLISALEDRGYVAWDQVACHALESRRLIDALAFNKDNGIQIRAQAKRLFTRQQEAGLITRDIEAMDTFALNEKANEGREILKPKSVYGLVVAITHYESVAEWWSLCNEYKDESPCWKDLGSYLAERSDGRGAIPVPAENAPYESWILYSWHRIT